MSVSRLEHSLDSFLFAFASKYPNVAHRLRPAYPYKVVEKIDFLIDALIACPTLRTQPIWSNGRLDLNWLGYALQQVFEDRNAIAHGMSVISELSEEQVVVHFRKWTRVSKFDYCEEAFSISTIGLDLLSERADSIRRYLDSLEHFLMGVSSWEKNYKADCRIRENWQLFVELGIAEFDPIMRSYIMTYDKVGT